MDAVTDCVLVARIVGDPEDTAEAGVMRRDAEVRPLAEAVWVGENVRCVAVAVGVIPVVDVGG